MLRQRILTAVVLVLVLAGALWWSPLAFGAVIAAGAAAALFEWLRLAGWRDDRAVLAGAAFGAALFVLQWFAPEGIAAATLPLCAIAVLAWCGIVALLVRLERRQRRLPLGPALLVALAILLIGACWTAVQALLRSSGLLLLSAMAIVWLADIAAYFAGRRFGRRKLAPQISPGKTWAGVWGALVAVLGCAFLARAAWPAAPLATTAIIAARGALGACLLLALLVAASIAGDLFESLLKRQAGVKDSSRLLPGHGGVLDRIDALLPVLPLVVLILAWRA